jgi:hypothetical protein
MTYTVKITGSGVASVKAGQLLRSDSVQRALQIVKSIREMTPKTGAERVADHNARLRDQGLKQVRSLWAHPDDIPAIRAYAARLLKKRQR